MNTVRARTRVLHGLLEEEVLKEGPIERLAADLGAPGRLLVAVAYAKRGRLRSARSAVKQALELAPEDAVVVAAAGMVSFVTRDYHLSLERLQRAVEKHAGSAVRWLTLSRDFAARLGWDREERAALEALTRIEATAPKAHVNAARLHARRLDWQAALGHVDTALGALPTSATLHMERARLLVSLGQRPEALASVTRAIALEGDSYAFQMEAGLVARSAGGFEAAAAYFERAEALIPGAVEPRFRRAEMVAWRGELERAWDEASACLAADPAFASAERLRGAIAYCRGETDEAERLLRRALELDPKESEARAWLAEIYIGRKDYEAADRQLYSAVADASGYSFPAALLRLLFSFPEKGGKVSLSAVQEVLAPLSALDPRYAAVLRAGDTAECLALVREVLARLGCNRSTVPTLVVEGALEALPAVAGLRYRSRVALQQLRVVGASEVARKLRELAAEEPELALALCHLGELELWMGDYEQARRTLEATLAIQRRTRWAWIGLTLIAVLLGDPEEGLRLSAEGIEAMGNTIGPAVYAHRGDAHRMAGHLDEAAQDLEQSLKMHPRRVAARVSYGLVKVAQGDAAGALEALAQVMRTAPGLVSDAARELGVSVWGDPGDALAPEVVHQVLERTLLLLRGNRSASSITYVTGEGHLRGCDFGQESSGLHTGDEAALYEARRLALALLDRHPTAGPRAASRAAGATPRAASKRVLSDADVEAFVRDGFVRVEGCFQAAYAAAVREGVAARLTRDPLRWAKHRSPAEAEALSAFSMTEPGTWPFGTLHVEGELVISLPNEMPRLWRAASELLQGAAIYPDKIRDYMILNPGTGVGEIDVPRVPTHDWHVDDPSAIADLERIINGLVLIILFDEVQPTSGGTLVMPGSAGEVARYLADPPAGADLAQPGVVLRLAEQVGRLHEVVGRAGDVYLMHPFLIHTATANPSTRMRWMANPTLFLEAPLVARPRAGHTPSPVELLIWRALGYAG